MLETDLPARCADHFSGGQKSQLPAAYFVSGLLTDLPLVLLWLKPYSRKELPVVRRPLLSHTLPKKLLVGTLLIDGHFPISV